jgi:hypothetical protein
MYGDVVVHVHTIVEGIKFTLPTDSAYAGTCYQIDATKVCDV